MKEFMLLVRNEMNHDAAWSSDQSREFLKKCENYIGDLKKNGKLILAQPLAREGQFISNSKGEWKGLPLDKSKEIIVGYYHIRAEDFNEAVAIAKKNPEFDYGTTARVEVRPVKTKETDTGFVYE